MTNNDATNPANRATLYAKIAAVTAAVKRIPKNGVNSFYHYPYALESDITDGLREIMAEHHLASLPPSVLAWERGDPDAKGNSLTRVQYRFGLADCETGETVEAIWWGEAQDNADKAFSKAATNALKYFLMKTFLIATGDDPDESGEPAPPQPQRRAPQQPAQRTTPATDSEQAPFVGAPLKMGEWLEREGAMEGAAKDTVARWISAKFHIDPAKWQEVPQERRLAIMRIMSPLTLADITEGLKAGVKPA